jgi:hypothetical protein
MLDLQTKKLIYLQLQILQILIMSLINCHNKDKNDYL